MRDALVSTRPDFAMVGGQSDGKFYIIASKTLTQAELRWEADYLEPLYFGAGRMLDRQFYTLTAEMRDITMTVGDSYAEAFRTLFDEWSPEPDRPALPAPVRAITAAPKALP